MLIDDIELWSVTQFFDLFSHYESCLFIRHYNCPLPRPVLYQNRLNLLPPIVLQDCMQRTIPYYVDKIVPDSIAQGKNVLIASSENAIRGLLMHLCEVSVCSLLLHITSLSLFLVLSSPLHSSSTLSVQ
jgi:hypothetical protein